MSLNKLPWLTTAMILVALLRPVVAAAELPLPNNKLGEWVVPSKHLKNSLFQPLANPNHPVTTEQYEPIQFSMSDMKMAPMETSHPTAPSVTGTSSAMAMMMAEMQRFGSGTGWQPMDNPMLMKMWTKGPWMSMLHGSAFLDDDNQGGSRGSSKIISQNWLMGSVARTIGRHNYYLMRVMLSGEPLTVGQSGYPLLFQTGESLHGQPLIDTQHPHDLFMEVSTQFLHQLGEQTWLRLYAAPSGEPALGPVAFPHRYSALLIPEAVLSHHMMDSSHISYGVLTAGIIHRKWQIEGSVFNGREPDEDRYDFDYSPWKTSASGRISYLPNDHWALQVSSGFLNHPDALKAINVERTTASAMYSRTWKTGWLASTLAWGHNFEQGPDDNGVLWEATYNFKNRNYLFSRIENIQRHGLFINQPDAAFNVTAFGLGAARTLLTFKGFPLTLGAMITMYAKPHSLNAAYRDFPISFHVFLHTNFPRRR